ncbi:MAG: hypothetical protein IT380_21085 [Myxococcales bacterium]|nr:hypothetical protein [Myxococcales bacterium]
MSRSIRNGLLAVCLSFFFAACSCGKPPIKPTDVCLGVSGAQADRTQACEENNECAEHFGCRDVKDKEGVKCCVFVDRACTTEADCCPGQTCPADRKKCFDKYLSCTTDADCGDKGDRFCEVYTDNYGSSSRCRFHVCGALGECPEGQACFQGECLAGLPCNGTCEPGKACVPSSDRCQDYASPTGRPEAACPVSCAAGFLATFQDSRNIWDSCNLPPVKCTCAELPGLSSGDLARYSAIAADPGSALYVSAYDGQYGDLVVVKYGLDGVKKATEYVDGVPTGAPKYGPSGARGGVEDPGLDVGRYTDVAVANGRVYVSYYDVANGDLKLAVRAADATWTRHRVDGTTADVGLYTSIAIDSEGFPGVSYFQRGGDATFNVMDCPAPRPTGAVKYITALKFARATTQTPASDGDWVVKTVACQSRPPPVCDGCTGLCADPGMGPGCFMAGTGCTGCDTSTEVCVNNAGTNECAKTFIPPELVEISLGVGLFSSVTFDGKEAIIAYMRRNAPAMAGGLNDGDLYAVRVNAQNTPGAPVLLDGSGDTGYFPDVKLEPATKSIAIGYHDFTSKAFKFYFSPQLQAGVTPEVIDTGVDMAAPGNQSWVGTDSAIVFGPSAGQVWAVYQDATKGDLKVARRTVNWAVQSSLATEGAVGFFADGVFTDGKVYASHARLKARLVQGEAKVANSLLLEQLAGN